MQVCFRRTAVTAACSSNRGILVHFFSIGASLDFPIRDHTYVTSRERGGGTGGLPNSRCFEMGEGGEGMCYFGRPL